jgi:hypothetical protein
MASGVYPALKENATCDVVVLGGGTAEHLLRTLAREGQVVVLTTMSAPAAPARARRFFNMIDTPLTDLAKENGRRDAEQAYRVC